MLAAGAINFSALLKMLYASLAAGIGVAVVFSLAILATVRASELRRTGGRGAGAYGVMAAVSAILTTAIVVIGLILVAHK